MKCIIFIILFGFSGLAMASVTAKDYGSQPLTPAYMRRPVTYARTLLLDQATFGQQEIERVNIVRWVNNTGISFATKYALETNLTEQGLELKFKVEGPAHLVVAFYKYVLANIETVAQMKNGWVDGVLRPDYKQTWTELSVKIEREIRGRALRDEVTMSSDCDLKLVRPPL